MGPSGSSASRQIVRRPLCNDANFNVGLPVGEAWHTTSIGTIMVKYADGPSTSVEVDIDAPPSAVWPYLCDINAAAAFSEEFQGADWIDDGPALGATFRGRNKHPMVGEWSVVCTITAMDPERAFEWTVGDVDNRTARWRFDLEPSDTGSRLRFTSEIGPGPSGLTPAIERMPDREEDIVAGRMQELHDNMTRTVEGYRQLVATSQQPS